MTSDHPFVPFFLLGRPHFSDSRSAIAAKFGLGMETAHLLLPISAAR